MRILALLVAALASGCGNHVYRLQVSNVEKVCKEHGGWADIDATGACVDARCVDGTPVSCTQVQLRPDG
jgi:hypothetical protein